jgi:hypothetical protein
MAGEPVPFNYRYFIEHAARLGGRSLDYGCGVGDGIAVGHADSLIISRVGQESSLRISCNSLRRSALGSG